MVPDLHEPDQRQIEANGSDEIAWGVRFGDGTGWQSGRDVPRFTFHVPTRIFFEHLLRANSYSAATAFLRGDFDVEGDLEAAIRYKGWDTRRSLLSGILGMAVRVSAAVEGATRTVSRVARNIRFHYDRSNEFYRLFLDSRMVYSCAYFRSAGMSLEEAQLAKLDHICRKLELLPGDRFLDIGCGWGALIGHAARLYGARATGCTLSRAQHQYAAAHVEGVARVLDCDYRDLKGRYDKIASVGMFEHVGRRRAHEYFRKLAALLEPDGLLLNHAIARPRGVREDAASLFVRRYIFPGGQLIHLDETIRAAEDNGFEVINVESLRPHYALTCRMWEQRLSANREAALRLVDGPTFRAWRLWLAASALSFAEGFSSVYQVLLCKRGVPRPHLTRDFLYRGAGTLVERAPEVDPAPPGASRQPFSRPPC